MLVAPHNVSAAGFSWARPLISLWAVVFFVAGAGLITAAAIAVPWWIRLSMHFLVGVLVLVVAAGFAARGVTAGMLNYTVLGLGTAAAAFIGEAQTGPGSGSPRDLFALLIGTNGILMGALMLVSPQRLGPGLLMFLHAAASWYGVCFLGAGLLLVYAHVTPTAPVVVRKLAHVVTAAAYVGVAALEARQPGSATGIVFFGGFGIAVGVLPWIDRPMRRTDPASLRVRLAVALAAAVAVPVILVVTLATAQEQHVVMDDQLTVQRASATGLANSIADYVRLHRAAVAALAAHPGLISMPPNEQTALLESFATAYTDPVSFALYDTLGHPLARSDGLPLTPGDGIPAFEAVRTTLIAQMVAGRSPLTGQPELTIGAPLAAADGTSGVVIATLPVARLSDLLSRTALGARDRVFLVTDAGDLVAYSGSVGATVLDQMAALPSVAALVKSKAPAGAVAYRTSAAGWLSGYARVPSVWVCPLPCNGVLGWAVVVEEPADSALTSVNAERNLAFSLLLIAITFGVILGVVGGGGLARPLAALATAMGQYTETGSEVPLPRSTTSEVARLAASFAEMRKRVSARTEERQRAEEALRRESALVRLLQEAATIANEGGTSGEVFRAVLELICRSTGWAVGHVWLVSKEADGVTLEPAPVWYVDEPQRRHVFRQATAPLRLAPGEGLPGQVLATGQPAWVADLSKPQDPRCQALVAAGLKTGCAIPVEAAGQMAAVMEFFSADVREHERMFLETIAIAGTQIGHVLEREQRNREAALLDELAELLQTSMTTTEAYAVFERFGRQCFPEAAGTLFVVSPSRDVLEQASAWGAPAGRAAAMAPDDCWALRRGHPHFSERAAGVVCPHLGESSRISLCVPIAAQNESLGLLHLEWAAPSGRDGARDGLWEARERLAVTLASQIGPAITNLRLRDTLRAQSIRDPLTGLFNRRYMEESLEREIHRSLRRSTAMAVMMLDIDFFKLFNDTYGHEAGDAVLSAFGTLLLSNSRKEDIACRYGGEEFALILSEATHKEALDRAEQLRAVAADLHVRHRGDTLGSITVSVGVAVFPTHGTNGKALLRAADTALYRAKQNGRARVEVAL